MAFKGPAYIHTSKSKRAQVRNYFDMRIRATCDDATTFWQTWSPFLNSGHTDLLSLRHPQSILQFVHSYSHLRIISPREPITLFPDLALTISIIYPSESHALRALAAYWGGLEPDATSLLLALTLTNQPDLIAGHHPLVLLLSHCSAGSILARRGSARLVPPRGSVLMSQTPGPCS